MPKEGRKPEPAIAPDVTGAEIDRSVRQQLRTLSKENAEGVAQHLVMVAALLEAEDLERLDLAFPAPPGEGPLETL